MNIKQEQLQILGEMVEKVLFDKTELEEVKQLITDVSKQKIPPLRLKKSIIELRGSMMDKLIQLFPLYNKSLSNNKEIEKFGTGNTEITKELEEKNSLLEKVGTKLQELELRLQKEFLE
jgi:hypothetical protein